MGGTMRLVLILVVSLKELLAHKIYNKTDINERQQIPSSLWNLITSTQII